MQPVETRGEVLRFDAFEIDLDGGELRKYGVLIPLQDKPLQLLVLLAENSGRLVTRREIRDRLWGFDTFVEFDDSLNHVVKKVRQALGDSAEHPRFIKTLPRRGYRFLQPVRRAEPVEIGSAPRETANRTGSRTSRTERRPRRAVILLSILAVAGAVRFGGFAALAHPL